MPPILRRNRPRCLRRAGWPVLINSHDRHDPWRDVIIKAMEPLTYLQLQMLLEGKEIVSGCFIRQIEIIPDEELPLMLIAQLANEELVAYYAETISHQLQVQLAG